MYRLNVSLLPPCVNLETQIITYHLLFQDKLEILQRYLLFPMRNLVQTAEYQILHCEKEHRVR